MGEGLQVAVRSEDPLRRDAVGAHETRAAPARIMGDRRRMTAESHRLRTIDRVIDVGRLEPVRPFDRRAVTGGIIAVGQSLGRAADRRVHGLDLIGRRTPRGVIAIDMDVAAQAFIPCRGRLVGDVLPDRSPGQVIACARVAPLQSRRTIVMLPDLIDATDLVEVGVPVLAAPRLGNDRLTALILDAPGLGAVCEGRRDEPAQAIVGHLRSIAVGVNLGALQTGGVVLVLPPGVGGDPFGTRVRQRTGRIADTGGEPAFHMGRLTGRIVTCARGPPARIHRHDRAIKTVVAGATDVARRIGHRQRFTGQRVGRDRLLPGLRSLPPFANMGEVAVQIINPLGLDIGGRRPDLCRLATQSVIGRRRRVAARVGDAGHVAGSVASVGRRQVQTARLRRNRRLAQAVGGQAAPAPDLACLDPGGILRPGHATEAVIPGARHRLSVLVVARVEHGRRALLLHKPLGVIGKGPFARRQSADRRRLDDLRRLVPGRMILRLHRDRLTPPGVGSAPCLRRLGFLDDVASIIVLECRNIAPGRSTRR
ncbi:hypothetical protein D3C71_308820 [compost metagenome]